MGESDIYAAPAASLSTSKDNGDYGSVERAIAGEYEFSIGATLSEAWQRVSGRKMVMFLAFLVYFAAYVGVSLVAGVVGGILGVFAGETASQFISFLISIVTMLAFIPMNAGFLMLGVKGSVDQPLDVSSVFSYFDKSLNLIVAMFIMYVLVFIGFMLFILPGIYLMVAYALVIPLIADKGLGPWEALEASRKAISKRWFSVFGLLLIIGVLSIIATIPLAIGMIWVGPLCVLSLGVMYRNMFGVEGPAA
ncbi:DUF975 family protein [Aurantivibrio plasticivorans]